MSSKIFSKTKIFALELTAQALRRAMEKIEKNTIKPKMISAAEALDLFPPGTTQMFLPDDWDEQTVQTDDDDDETIWHRLYWWLHLYHGCELEGIFRKVYVGYELHERLLRMERERIKKKYKLTGTKLTKETMWSNFNYGPKISVENYGKIIKGNVLFFLKNEEDADEIET